jgi:hypothetical protein
MAQTDTRSGFRLPWSSDRAHEDPAGADAADGAPEAVAAEDASPVAWPESDFAARTGITPSAPRAADATRDGAAPAGRYAPSAAPAPAPAPRKPTKLMADLAAAIRATTEAARDQRLGQVEADALSVVEMIRAQSSEGAAALRRKSDGDVDSIRDWAKAEIARIKQESDSRVAERQRLLDRELEGHATAIEDRVAEVQSSVTAYRQAMETYYSRLAAEEDPARLATMAEAMPDAPALDELGDLHGLVVAPTPEAVAEPEPAVEAVAAPETAWSPEPEAAWSQEPASEPVAEAGVEAPEAVADAIAEAPEAVVEAPEAVAETATGAPEAVAEVAPVDAETDPHAAALDDAEAASAAEAETEHPVTGALDAHGDAEAIAHEGGPNAEPAGDAGVARWTEGEAPEGFPDAVEGGDPVDRGAIMAALEAAAEAVVAAEAAAESADQAEAAADVAETAAELLKGRKSSEDEVDPEAEAALSARVDAGGFDTESYADRLASLLPSHAEGAADGEPRTTQVVVTGLVSVASIASFKRHLGRLAGVTAVTVASGPDGEFVFNVNHRPDVSFRDAIPTMPGFAARVTGTGDGIVSVSARDPESEG